MLNLLRFLKADADSPRTQFDPSSTSTADLQLAYQWHFDRLAARLGLECDGIRVSAVHAGHAAGSRLPVFIMTIRLERWAGRRTLLLLLGLPLVEKAVRRALKAGWVLEASVFAGVWLHASAGLRVPPTLLRELREAAGHVPEVDVLAPPGDAAAEAGPRPIALGRAAA